MRKEKKNETVVWGMTIDNIVENNGNLCVGSYYNS